ncbi:MAG: class III poly(R)-hydroxyalkanoic acid synthase subunit PhaC [Cellvibrionaceae bacterium]
MSLLPQLDPYAALEEIAELNSKMVEGAKNLSSIKDNDVHIATTDKETVFTQDKVTLHHYKSRNDQQSVKTPVIVVYGLIGRYTMTDLQEDRSLIRNLLEKGVDVYAVDWGTPTRADRWLKLEDYINDYLHNCIEFIKDQHNLPKINILGVCEGGVFSICYAALHPNNVNNLMTSITPVDFHGDQRDDKQEHGYINLWTRNLDASDIDLMVSACGNMPGELMGMVFQLLTPLKSLTKYNIDLLDIAHDEKKLLNFLRMEKWLADRPDHPGEAAKQWFKDLYQDNKLIQNQFMLDGDIVDLKQVTMPVLNIYALNDHIIPPECSMALKTCVGSEDYTDLPLPGGHVGVFVSGKSQGILGKGIVDWLVQRDN